MSSRNLTHTYTLRVELEGVRPLIWRRILVDGSVSLGKLHHYLQAAMGWTDAHLHEFEIAGQVFAIPHPDDDPDRPAKDERRATLSKVVGVGEHFLYRYDFGDSWSHRIVVEAVDQSPGEPAGVAEVAAGERACPPEDVGGAEAYMEFVEAVSSRRTSEDAQDWLAWAGTDFDPERFDRIAANAALLRMAWNKWV